MQQLLLRLCRHRWGPTRAMNRLSDMREPTMPGRQISGGTVAMARARTAPSVAQGPTPRARARVSTCCRAGREDQNSSVIFSLCCDHGSKLFALVG